MNIPTNSGSEDRKGRIRLITTSFSKPSGPREEHRYSSAIPPSASLRRTKYFPMGIPATSVKPREDSLSALSRFQPSGFPHQRLKLVQPALEGRDEPRRAIDALEQGHDPFNALLNLFRSLRRDSAQQQVGSRLDQHANHGIARIEPLGLPTSIPPDEPKRPSLLGRGRSFSTRTTLRAAECELELPGTGFGQTPHWETPAS